MDNLSRFFAKEDVFSKLSRMLETQDRLTRSPFSSVFDTINIIKSPLMWDKNPMSQMDKIFKIYESNPTHFPLMDDYLKGIKKNHLDIFSNWDKLARLTQTDKLGRQIKNMERVLSGVTFQATELLSRRGSWDLLEDFDEITNEVAVISERVTAQESVTKTDLDEIKQIIQGIEIKIDQKDKDFFSILLKWMAIVSFIMMIVQEKRYQDSKDEALTKADFEKFKIEVTQTIKDKLTKIEDVRTIGRDCNLRLKPGTRTLIIGKISKGDKVIILQTSGKWVYIQMKDDLTTHGWVYKKYLDK